MQSEIFLRGVSLKKGVDVHHLIAVSTFNTSQVTEFSSRIAGTNAETELVTFNPVPVFTLFIVSYLR